MLMNQQLFGFQFWIYCLHYYVHGLSIVKFRI